MLTKAYKKEKRKFIIRNDVEVATTVIIVTGKHYVISLIRINQLDKYIHLPINLYKFPYITQYHSKLLRPR